MNRKKQASIKKKDVALFILCLAVIVESIVILNLWPKKIIVPKATILKPEIKKYKIALVIDDWGYNKRNLHYLKEIDCALTISILPQLRYSKEIDEYALANNKEVIIHLPLEPRSTREVGLEKNIIKTSMTEKEIVNIFQQDMESVPNVQGVSNHMGSKATEDTQTMQVIFSQLKKYNLYFLDSYVSPDSICEELSEKMHLRFAKRDVFLDNESNEAYIKSQFNQLIKKAEQKGFAIGIAHDRPLSLETLKKLIGEYQNSDIEFVFLSELVN